MVAPLSASNSKQATAPVNRAADFQNLDPQHVLDALQAVGLYGDGRVLQLNSYENRVFQVFLEDGSAVVAKFYRPGRWSNAQIVEEHSFALELAAAEVPVIPPLVLVPPLPAADQLQAHLQLHGEPPTLACWRPASTLPKAANTPQAAAAAATAAAPDPSAANTRPPPELRFAVALRSAGREPELEDPAALRQLGRFIGRLHAVGKQKPFVHRHHLNVKVDGATAMQALIKGGFVTPAELPVWQQTCEAALTAVADAFESRFSPDEPLATLRLHGDCHLGNVLWRRSDTGGSPHVVDLDDAMQGPAVQDLWMLVSGDHSSMAQQLNGLLEGYEEFCDFDDRERALIEPLRTLRMLRHSAWLADRWTDPSFPQNFPFFGSAAYWSQQTAQLREQLELMQSAAR